MPEEVRGTLRPTARPPDHGRESAGQLHRCSPSQAARPEAPSSGPAAGQDTPLPLRPVSSDLSLEETPLAPQTHPGWAPASTKQGVGPTHRHSSHRRAG